MKKSIFSRHPVWRSVVLAFAGLVLGMNIYVWNAKNLVGNALPTPLGYGAAVVMSGSMEPTLSVDDLVLIRETDQVQAGDILVYQSGRELVIHRAVKVDGQTVYTQGDANADMDEPVNMSAVKGKLVGRIPRVGLVVRFLKNPWGVTLVLLLALGLTEGSFRQQKARDAVQLEAVEAEIHRLQHERK